MPPLNRRELFSGALAGAAAVAISHTASAEESVGEIPHRPWEIIDTNVSLFQWPFRRLPYDAVDELVGKLDSLRIRQAWAGSFEGILHRDLSGVNARLAETCRDQGRGLLIPFGSVNVELPGWEEDLRRCHEEHRMPGVRLHPNYHDYSLDDARFARLLAMAAERGLLVQLAASMEDRRTQHPGLQVPDVDLSPLPDLMKKVAGAKVLLLNWKQPSTSLLEHLADIPGLYLDMARVEATDGVAQLVRSVRDDRVVFGTHAPFFVYESALIKVYESELTESEAGALFGQNAKRLFAER